MGLWSNTGSKYNKTKSDHKFSLEDYRRSHIWYGDNIYIIMGNALNT